MFVMKNVMKNNKNNDMIHNYSISVYIIMNDYKLINTNYIYISIDGVLTLDLSTALERNGFSAVRVALFLSSFWGSLAWK